MGCKRIKYEDERKKNLEEKIIETIIKPTISGLKNEGAPFKGVLFAGLMIENVRSRAMLYLRKLGLIENLVADYMQSLGKNLVS